MPAAPDDPVEQQAIERRRHLPAGSAGQHQCVIVHCEVRIASLHADPGAGPELFMSGPPLRHGIHDPGQLAGLGQRLVLALVPSTSPEGDVFALGKIAATRRARGGPGNANSAGGRSSSSCHRGYGAGAPGRTSALSRRRTSSSALPSTRPPVMQLLATPIQTAFHVTEPTATAETTAAMPASRRRIGTDLCLRTNLTTRLLMRLWVSLRLALMARIELQQLSWLGSSS